jgi:ubiquinone/menaquinone biosynthesis C-methylase UbiE
MSFARARFATVADHFSAESHYWAVAYAGDDVTSLIYQQRLALALDWVDGLRAPDGSRALDLGTGAGQAAVAIAQRGWRVDAVDGSRRMASLARDNANRAGLGERVHTLAGDAQALTFADGSFDLVLALGLLPWVQAPDLTLAEVARVLRPNGTAILSTANRGRLTFRLDPLRNQEIQPLKRPVRAALERLGWWPAANPEPVLHSLRESDRLVADAGLERVAGQSFGFGPFTLLGRRVFSARTDVRLARWLDALAARRAVGLHRAGVEYLVLARKAL